MIIYKLARTKYAKDLTGLGAKINGGRWNRIGVPCIYAAESRALALLEYSANISLDDLPRSLSIVAFEVPAHAILAPPVSKLPGNWRDGQPPDSTQEFGSKMLLASKMLLIKVPSAIVPEEFNYIINPLHPDIKRAKIVDISDFSYDVRLKK